MGSKFPISALVARSKVPRATIRHYLRIGLLPPPERVTANRFLYDQRHSEALRLIRMLRRRRKLPLATIREILPELLRRGPEEASRPENWDEAIQRLGLVVTPRERLLRSAVEIFSRREIGSTTIEEICRAAGVQRAAFYRYFGSKDELLLEATRRTAADLIARFKAQVLVRSPRARQPLRSPTCSFPACRCSPRPLPG